MSVRKFMTVAMAVVLLLSVLPGIASAQSSPDGTWGRRTVNGWETWLHYPVDGTDPQGFFDPDCGTTRQIWKIVIYVHTNFQGERTTICGVHNEGFVGDASINGEEDFCFVTLTGAPQPGCINGGGDAIDNVSSVKVLDIKNTGGCAKFYQHQDYTWSSFKLFEGQQLAVLPSGFNDYVQSVKRVYAYQC